MGKMTYSQVGDIKKPAAKICMGSMVLTLKDDVTGSEWMEKTKADSFTFMDEAYELGYDTYDTAIIYAGQESELTIGEWMEDRGLREKMFILDKGGALCTSLTKFGPEAMMRDIFISLDRLRTNYIDLYMPHRDNPEVPIEELIDALAYMQQKGYIHGYGGSNWIDINRTKRAIEYAKEKGYPEFIAAQPGYTLAVPIDHAWSETDECLNDPKYRKNLEFYKETQMAIFTWSSMARGFWSGVYDRGTAPKYKDTWDKTCIKSFWGEPNWQRMDRVKEYSVHIGASVPNIALAWLLNQPLKIHPIIGANNRADLESNLVALDIKMDQQTREWLNLEADERPW